MLEIFNLLTGWKMCWRNLHSYVATGVGLC